jgi:hypothetical protein
MGFIVILCLLLGSAVPGWGQVTGSLHSARPLAPQQTDVGGYLGFYDGDAHADIPMAAFGHFRHGLFATGDVGLKFGLVDPDDRDNDIGFVMAADAQWSILSPRWGDSFWLAGGPEVLVQDGDNARIWGFGGNLPGSYDFLIRNKSVTVYSRLNLRVEVTDPDYARAETTSDLKVGLNPGIIWPASDFVDLIGEIQIDDMLGVIFGVNFKI